MKRIKKAKAPSDSTLQGLWRKVVRAEWGNKCAFYDATCYGSIQCHHIVKRARPHLRHVPSNGIPLCEFHHAWADTWAGRKRIEWRVGEDKMEWLAEQERKLFPAFLAERGQTRAEYLVAQKAYLQALVNGEGA
jgi:hypothetical protein